MFCHLKGISTNWLEKTWEKTQMYCNFRVLLHQLFIFLFQLVGFREMNSWLQPYKTTITFLGGRIPLTTDHPGNRGCSLDDWRRPSWAKWGTRRWPRCPRIRKSHLLSVGCWVSSVGCWVSSPFPRGITFLSGNMPVPYINFPRFYKNWSCFFTWPRNLMFLKVGWTLYTPPFSIHLIL